MTLSNQQRQAIVSGCGFLVSLGALWGLNIEWLNSPVIQGLIATAVGALASFLVKTPEPSLTEAYHVVEKANQAREAERWRADRQPAGLLDDDGFKRPDAAQP